MRLIFVFEFIKSNIKRISFKKLIQSIVMMKSRVFIDFFCFVYETSTKFAFFFIFRFLRHLLFFFIDENNRIYSDFFRYNRNK